VATDRVAVPGPARALGHLLALRHLLASNDHSDAAQYRDRASTMPMVSGF
jgi:hypothetical protein